QPAKRGGAGCGREDDQGPQRPYDEEDASRIGRRTGRDGAEDQPHRIDHRDVFGGGPFIADHYRVMYAIVNHHCVVYATIPRCIQGAEIVTVDESLMYNPPPRATMSVTGMCNRTTSTMTGGARRRPLRAGVIAGLVALFSIVIPLLVAADDSLSSRRQVLLLSASLW